MLPGIVFGDCLSQHFHKLFRFGCEWHVSKNAGGNKCLRCQHSPRQRRRLDDGMGLARFNQSKIR